MSRSKKRNSVDMETGNIGPLSHDLEDRGVKSDGEFSFGLFASNLPIDQDEGTMRISLKKLNPEARYHVKYRDQLEKCEFLAHEAFDAGHNSVQRVIEERLYPRNWRKMLDESRSRHRKMGYKDYEFYPNSAKQKLGLKAKPGRHKLSKKLMKAAA